MKRNFLRMIGAALALAAAAMAHAQPVTLHAATQFNDEHDYNRTLKRFGELVSKYYGQPVNVVIRGNSELGTERDYAKFMNQGVTVDVSILAGSNMGNFSKAAPLLDVPFVFRDREHWSKAIARNGMKPLLDQIEQQSGMAVIGICGGSTRHLVATKPIRTMRELAGYKMRVIGAPIQGKVFGVLGAKTSVIAYNEVYGAIQAGVIEGLENEAPAILNAKFYEVAPEISLTSHAVVTRLLVMSSKTLKRLPPPLQVAIRKAGGEAAAFNREVQEKEERVALARMVADKKVNTHVFTERARLLEVSKPVVFEFAKEAGVEKILADIQAIR